MSSSKGSDNRHSKLPPQLPTNNANSSSRRQRQPSTSSTARTDSPPLPSKRSRHLAPTASDERRAADTITLEQLRHTLARTEASGGRHQDHHDHSHDHYHHHYHEPRQSREERDSRHRRHAEEADGKPKCEVLQGAIRHIERAEEEASQRRREAEIKKARRQTMMVLPRREPVESSGPALAYRTRVR